MRLACVAAAAALLCAGAAVGAPRSVSVATVRVTRDGLWHADPNGRQTPQSCRRFRLSSAAARRWFARARDVDQRAWLEELDWTQCSAQGDLRTVDGRRRRWELDQSGRGRVIVSPTAAVYLAGPELPFSGR